MAVVAPDNKIPIQAVRVGDRSGNQWVIEEGLRAGDRVVVEGIQKVREGVTVMTTNSVTEQVGSDRRQLIMKTNSPLSSKKTKHCNATQ